MPPIDPGYPTPPYPLPPVVDTPPDPPEPSPTPIVPPVVVPSCGFSSVTNYDPITGRPLDDTGYPYGDSFDPDPVSVNGPDPTCPTTNPVTGNPTTPIGPVETHRGIWTTSSGNTYFGTELNGDYYDTGDPPGPDHQWTGYTFTVPSGTILVSPVGVQFTYNTPPSPGSTVIITGFLVENSDGTWSFYITSVVIIDPSCPIPRIPLPTAAQITKFEEQLAPPPPGGGG